MDEQALSELQVLHHQTVQNADRILHALNSTLSKNSLRGASTVTAGIFADMLTALELSAERLRRQIVEEL